MPAEQAPQANQSNEAYLAQHPNAVIDPSEASEMAYASKPYEEQTLQMGKKALDAAVGGDKIMAGQFDRETGYARDDADRVARLASARYHRL